jgi:alpha-glucosidase (family GH31 glycosyl hydrolase)
MNSPEDVVYSTRYNKDSLKFAFDTFFKVEQAFLNSTGKIFGLGERTGEFWLQPGTYTVWPKNQPSPVEDGS